MTGARAGDMGESTWTGPLWTAPVSEVWQALLVRAELPECPPGNACASAWCRSNRQRAAHPTAGWASRKAAKVAKARMRERRAWSIAGIKVTGGRTGGQATVAPDILTRSPRLSLIEASQ